MLPFATMAVAAAAARLESRWFLRSLLIATIIVSVAIYALSSALYPQFPEKFTNPVYEVTLRLLGEGYASYNLGYLFGLRGFASLVPYLLALLGLLLWITAPNRGELRVVAVAWTAAMLILAIYWRPPPRRSGRRRGSVDGLIGGPRRRTPRR
jgi:hypothetical protein